MGRPTDYELNLAADICGRLVSGESLSAICGAEEMPHVSTVYRWIAAHSEFRDMYARAREDQADTLADQVLEIADETPSWIPDLKDGTTYTLDGSAVAHQRLRIDARKWVASKLKPKKYGDKQALDLGSDPERPMISKIVREIVRPQDPNG